MVYVLDKTGPGVGAARRSGTGNVRGEIRGASRGAGGNGSMFVIGRPRGFLRYAAEGRCSPGADLEQR